MRQDYDTMAETPQVIAQEEVVFHPEATTRALPTIKNRQAFSQLSATVALVMVDLTILTIAMSLAFLIRINVLPTVVPVFPPEVPAKLLDQLWWVLIIGLLCLNYEGLYTRRLPFWREARKVIKAITLAFLLTLAVVSLAKISGEVSRTILVLGYMVSTILLPLGRLTAKTAFTRVGLGVQPVLILGADKTGEMVARALMRDSILGYRIVGFLDEDNAKRKGDVQVNNKSFPILGTFRDSDKIMEKEGIRHIIVATPGMPGHELVELVNRLQRRAASVTVIPDLFGVPVMGVEADYSFDDQMLSFRIKNNLASPINMCTKRIFDLVVGTAILFAVLPLMAIIAVAIKLDSRGPVFFSHRRIGRGGKEFNCYKFRTMYTNAQEVLEDLLQHDSALRKEWERDFKLKDDPRITRVGMFLRKTSLDELPQIFNVFKGEMSLVGPRPIVNEELDRFGIFISYLYMVRPGITGLWQVSGRNDIDYPERVQLESWYVRNWSLWLDITLLVRTVRVVLVGHGAY